MTPGRRWFGSGLRTRATEGPRVRYGVIGIGGFGDVHVRSVLEEPAAELVALVDTDEALAAGRAADLGVRAFGSHEALLDADIVDAVSIVVPHDLHAPIALDCFEAGVHVYVEKPLALLASEADAMIDASRARGLRLCVGHQYRTFRGSRVLKFLVETGELGPIRHGVWTHHVDRSASAAGAGWKGEWPRAGGGVVAYRAIHDLDLLCWLLGRPAEVTALRGGPPEAAGGGSIHAVIRFESGALVSFQASLTGGGIYNLRQFSGELGVASIAGTRSEAYDKGERILLDIHDSAPEAGEPAPDEPASGPGGGESRRFEIDIPSALYGPGASARAADGSPAALPPGLSDLLDSFASLPRPKRHGTSLLISGFLASIQDGGDPPVSGESARPAVELHNGLLLSSVRGETVRLPVDRDEYDAFFERLCREGRERPVEIAGA